MVQRVLVVRLSAADVRLCQTRHALSPLSGVVCSMGREPVRTGRSFGRGR